MADKKIQSNLVIQGGATTAGGKITLKGGLNGASADYPDWHIDSSANAYRLICGSTTRFTFDDSSGFAELTGNMRVTGTLFFGAGTIASATQSDTQAAQPFCNGPMLQGTTGWSFYHSGLGSHRMGFRGSATPFSTNYGWCADSFLIGSQPNDGAVTTTLRVIGSISGSTTIVAGSTVTATTSVHAGTSLNGQYCIPTASGDSEWSNNAIIINPGVTQACMSFHPGGVAPQIRVGNSDNNMYFRNSNNSAYVAVVAVINDQSSEKTKQDIVDWPPKPVPAMRSLLAVAEATEPVPSTVALDRVDKLKPKFFRRDRDNWLWQVRSMDGEDDGVHLCGFDCRYTPENPCPRVVDWQLGSVGLIAEEVYEVFPEAVSLGNDGKPQALSPTAIATAAIAAVQELRLKVEALEKKAK